MAKTTPTPETTEPVVPTQPVDPTPDTPPVPDANAMAPISDRQSDFEIVYADWAGTTPDQIEGLRLGNGSYENHKVAHCWHFYQLGSGGLEIDRVE